MKRKSIAIITSILMILLLPFTACSNKTAEENYNDEEITEKPTMAESDLSYIMQKGLIRVAVRDYNFITADDDDEESSSFDADIANAFAQYLDVDIEFVEIDWANKTFELDSKNVDCIINPVILTDNSGSSIEWSNAYINNPQILVIKSGLNEKYQAIEDCAGLKIATTKDSATKDLFADIEVEFIEFENVSEILDAIAEGDCDAGITNAVYALQVTGEGKAYEGLACGMEINPASAYIGFRNSSDIAEKFNKWFTEVSNDGYIEEMAAEYNLQSVLIKE